MRVLLLGATGQTGRRTTAELLRQPEVEMLWLGGRREAELAALVAAFGSPERVRFRAFDLAEARLHGNVFADADVVVSCAGPGYETEEPAARAAIEGGASYISLCDEYDTLARLRALDDLAVDADVTVVAGCGLSPGITNLLIEHGARQMDTVESIDIALARSSAESNGEATSRHFLYELSQDAPVINDHQLVFERPGSSPKLVYFPEPIGWVETYRIGHAEILTLPERYEGLSSAQFRAGLAEKVTMDTARAFCATPLARSERARRLFVAATKPLRPLIDRLPPNGPAWSGARVDLHGLDSGRTKTISLGVVDRLSNLVSVTLTLAALRLGDTRARRGGVLSVEEAFESPALLRDLSERGIGIAELEPRPV